MIRNLTWTALLFAAMFALLLGIFIDYSNDRQSAEESALKQVSFATDWKAQAEHGGFYQAKALGLYEKAGLEVTIRMGGPGANIPQLLATNSVEFGMGSNQFIAMNMAAEGIPAKAVMAVFQKDPQVLIAHQRDDVSSLEDMAGKPILVSDATIGAFWVWLRAKYGFTDDQIRKYTYSLAPFLSDKSAIQQGYVTSEPYTIEQNSGEAPQVFLLADNGYPGYATFVLSSDTMIAEDPETVRAFVEASIEGWRSYLTEDPTPGNALIKADNPEMTDEIIAQAIEKMNAYHLVLPKGDSGAGIGRMTDERWAQFHEQMSAEGLYEKDFDYRAAYTLDFLPAQ